MLATKNYFDGFRHSFKTFEEIVFHLNSKLKNIRIELMFGVANIKDINEVLSGLKLDLEWEKSKKEKYDYKAMLSFNDVKLLANLLKSKLEICFLSYH